MTEGGREMRELRGRLAAESCIYSQDRRGWGKGEETGEQEQREKR